MSEVHQTLDVHRARRDLDVLLERVARRWGRIEITRDDGGDSCVLLSKAELQSIERALEILCELPGGKEICEEIASVANRCVESFRSGARPFTPGAMLNEAGPDASASL